MAHHSQPSLKDCRVLIIEDEYWLADDIANALRALGAYVIGPVSEFADAMSVEHDCFDVAVVDINLRGQSTYPIADELMRIGKPFIFTTGYSAEIIPDRFRHVRQWVKPYQLEEVMADVAELCAREAPHVVA